MPNLFKKLRNLQNSKIVINLYPCVTNFTVILIKGLLNGKKIVLKVAITLIMLNNVYTKF